jgi:Arc/MetJ family transcription regulator
MRTTVVLDDDLLADAEELTGIKERSSLLRAALTALVERESARRLARFRGTMPDLGVPSRRNTEAA